MGDHDGLESVITNGWNTHIPGAPSTYHATSVAKWSDAVKLSGARQAGHRADLRSQAKGHVKQLERSAMPQPDAAFDSRISSSANVAMQLQQFACTLLRRTRLGGTQDMGIEMKNLLLMTVSTVALAAVAPHSVLICLRNPSALSTPPLRDLSRLQSTIGVLTILA